MAVAVLIEVTVTVTGNCTVLVIVGTPVVGPPAPSKVSVTRDITIRLGDMLVRALDESGVVVTWTPACVALMTVPV